MNPVILLVAVFSLANASLYGLNTGMMGLYGNQMMSGRRMMPDTGMMGDTGMMYDLNMMKTPGMMMHNKEMMKDQDMMEGADMMRNPGMMRPSMEMMKDQDMMKSRGMMRDQGMQSMMGPYNMMPWNTGSSMMGYYGVMNQYTNQMDHDMTEATEQQRMRRLLNNMEGTIQKTGSNMQETNDQVGQMADEITDQMREAQLAQMEQTLQEIEKQFARKMMMGLGSSMVQQMAKNEAMDKLKQTMMKYQGKYDTTTTQPSTLTHQMQQTLQVAIMAQVAMKDMENQHSVQMPTMMMGTGTFRNQVQQLLEQNNMLQTRADLVKYELQMQQIKMQLQFLNQQMQKVQVYKLMMTQKQGTETTQVPQTMQEVQQQMLQQQQKLMAQEIAVQMIITRLQQVLMSQQEMMQKMTVEQAEIEMNNPTMYMSSMRMKPTTMTS